MSRETQDLILAGALMSIAVNPFVFKLADWLDARKGPPRDPSPLVGEGGSAHGDAASSLRGG